MNFVWGAGLHVVACNKLLGELSPNIQRMGGWCPKFNLGALLASDQASKYDLNKRL